MNRVYLDTCCVIYLIEDVPGFSGPMRNRLAAKPDAILCVSALVQLEVLVKPLADGNRVLVSDYRDFLAVQEWASISDREFELATRLRAAHRLKTPDALHLAAAETHGCTEFWTNDDRLNHAAKAKSINVLAPLNP
ncbi:type II toxin-antitoxin system VapC family toxin [Lamprobacter modestohalophilus]|nr:type II toxin-antitoxin system VapC family toxin [Lamprobacter modestohalophilus]